MTETNHGGKREGSGRKPAGRTAALPRIKPEKKQKFQDIAEKRGISLAEAIEHSADVATKKKPRQISTLIEKEKP